MPLARLLNSHFNNLHDYFRRGNVRQVGAFDVKGERDGCSGRTTKLCVVATTDADFSRSRCFFEKSGQVSTRVGTGVDLHGAEVTPKRGRMKASSARFRLGAALESSSPPMDGLRRRPRIFRRSNTFA